MQHFHSRDAGQTQDPCSEDPAPVLPMEATDEVVRYYSPMVWRLAITKTQSAQDAEDIFQEVFLRLCANQTAFASEEHRKAWLIRVTVNCCNSHFVAPWRKKVVCLDDVALAQLQEETAPQPEGTPDIYAQVLRLPQHMREVVLLFYYEDLSIRDIAQALQITEVSVKKRLSRARQKLKMELEDASDSIEG